jgi:hypothetical protein
MDQGGDDRRPKVLADYRKTLLQHKEVDAKVRLARRRGRLSRCGCSVARGSLLENRRDVTMGASRRAARGATRVWHGRVRGLSQPFRAWPPPRKTLPSQVRSMRDEVKQLRKEYDKTEDDLKALQSVGQIIGEVLRQLDAERYIVKASSGPRYVVGCRSKLDKKKLVQGTRVTLDMTTLTIMRALPREVCRPRLGARCADPRGLKMKKARHPPTENAPRKAVLRPRGFCHCP